MFSRVYLSSMLQFTKTLFTTFMLQMIHWFTKNQNYQNPETMSMLETLMVGFDVSSLATLLFISRME